MADIEPIRNDLEALSLPHNIEAEQALLGAVLVNNEVLERVPSGFSSDHFHEPVHGRIYEAAVGLVGRGLLATPVTLKSYFEADEALAEIGGTDYLARLYGAAITIIDAEHYAKVIFDLAHRRELVYLAADVQSRALNPKVDDSAVEIIERAESHLHSLAERGVVSGFQSFATSLTGAVKMAEAAYQREGALAGLTTGLVDLDNLTGGLAASDVIVLASRPGHGKTALATNIAFQAALARRQAIDDADGAEVGEFDGAVVAFFSLEMSAEQLATRCVAQQSGISSNRLRRGDLNSDDFVRLVTAAQAIETIPFYIDDTATLDIGQIHARARRLQRTKGLGLVVVDYLQLLKPPPGKRDLTRVLEIGEITRGLKRMAKELVVPVLALAQLSRAVDLRPVDDRRPRMSDLRESGSIEQDADLIIFLFREEVYFDQSEPRYKSSEEWTKWAADREKVAGVAELICGKQRQGPTGKVEAKWVGESTMFLDYVADDHLPELVF